MEFPADKYEMPPIIGIIGKAGHGKSTVGAILGEVGYVNLPFANTLKNMLGVLGVTRDDMTGASKELPHPALCGKSPREALQLLGTEFGRDMIGKSVWIDDWNVRRRGLCAKYVVADDIRFLNEVDGIEQMGGVIVQVHRPHCEVLGGDHSSENSLASVNPEWLIVNDGDVADLRLNILRMLFGVSEKKTTETTE